jgi:hypothetical protein
MFARGTHAIAICDGCAFQCRYVDLKRDPQTGLYYCPQCGVDERDPVTPRLRADRIALHHPKPDLGYGSGVSPPPPPPVPTNLLLLEDGTPLLLEDETYFLLEAA